MEIPGDVKTIIVFLLGAAVIILFGYFFLENGSPQTFQKGQEINKETFLELFGVANKTYIVMDVRNVSSDIVKRNVLQCGIDFASSTPFAGRNVTYISMDAKDCYIGMSEKTEKETISNCMKILNRPDSITLYIKEGSNTTYYTRAAVIGVNENYAIGQCSLRQLRQK
jgi:CxxC motif-containing protein